MWPGCLWKVVLDNSKIDQISSIGGDLGNVSAMLLEGFFTTLENTIYALKIGEFSKPVRSSVRLPTLGRMVSDTCAGNREISQILVKNPTTDKDSYLGLPTIEKAGDFKQLVLLSEDANLKAGMVT
ncbi:MAG: hypothetical protein IPO69_09005 [Saprospiraceae bacterium]|nr:hypothetical protein [Saprospiraceae bacterium]